MAALALGGFGFALWLAIVAGFAIVLGGNRNA
jgi:hypothetical protein